MENHSRSTALFKALLFFIFYGVIIVAVATIKPIFNLDWQKAVWAYTSAILLLTLTIFIIRKEKSTLEKYRLNINRISPLKLLLGLLIGFTVFGIHLLVFILFVEGLTFVPIEGDRTYFILVAICSYIGTACMEGLGTRGYTLTKLADNINPWSSIVVSALVFGLFHIFFGFSTYEILAGVIPMGLVLAIAAHVSGGLALPIGVHAAWNISSWLVGDKRMSGVWEIQLSEQGQNIIAQVGLISNSAMMLLMAIGFWYWGKRNGKFN